MFISLARNARAWDLRQMSSSTRQHQSRCHSRKKRKKVQLWRGLRGFNVIGSTFLWQGGVRAEEVLGFKWSPESLIQLYICFFYNNILYDKITAACFLGWTLPSSLSVSFSSLHTEKKNKRMNEWWEYLSYTLCYSPLVTSCTSSCSPVVIQTWRKKETRAAAREQKKIPFSFFDFHWLL